MVVPILVVAIDAATWEGCPALKEALVELVVGMGPPFLGIDGFEGDSWWDRTTNPGLGSSLGLVVAVLW